MPCTEAQRNGDLGRWGEIVGRKQQTESSRQKAVDKKQTRPEPCKVRGSHAPNVVHGGARTQTQGIYERAYSIENPSE